MLFYFSDISVRIPYFVDRVVRRTLSGRQLLNDMYRGLDLVEQARLLNEFYLYA